MKRINIDNVERILTRKMKEIDEMDLSDDVKEVMKKQMIWKYKLCVARDPWDSSKTAWDKVK